MPRPSPPSRCIIVGATFPWRIAGQLRARGYQATSPKELGEEDIKEPPLIRMIAADLEPAVLVTFDNRMSTEHRVLRDRHSTTLAVVDKNARPGELKMEEYWRDVIMHRTPTESPNKCRVRNTSTAPRGDRQSSMPPDWAPSGTSAAASSPAPADTELQDTRKPPP